MTNSSLTVLNLTETMLKAQEAENELLDFYQQQSLNFPYLEALMAKRKTLQQELDQLSVDEKKQLATLCQEGLDHDQPNERVLELEHQLDVTVRQLNDSLAARDYWEKRYSEKRARPTFMGLGYALTTWFRDLAIGLLLIAIAVNMGLYVYGWIQ